jgi:hypothetical protein
MDNTGETNHKPSNRSVNLNIFENIKETKIKNTDHKPNRIPVMTQDCASPLDIMAFKGEPLYHETNNH